MEATARHLRGLMHTGWGMVLLWPVHVHTVVGGATATEGRLQTSFRASKLSAHSPWLENAVGSLIARVESTSTSFCLLALTSRAQMLRAAGGFRSPDTRRLLADCSSPASFVLCFSTCLFQKPLAEATFADSESSCAGSAALRVMEGFPFLQSPLMAGPPSVSCSSLLDARYLAASWLDQKPLRADTFDALEGPALLSVRL